MAKPQTIIRDGSGTRTATYQLPPGLFQYIESILVELDNGAAVAVRPTLKVETVNGRVMATKRQGESVPAGDTGTATWALRLTDEVAAGDGIEFDTDNIGGYLEIDANSQHMSVIDGVLAAWNIAMRGVNIGIGAVGAFANLVLASANVLQIHGGIIYLGSDTNTNLSAAQDMNITGDYIAITSATSNIDITSAGGFSLIGDFAQMEIRSGAGMLFEVNGGSANFTFEQWQVVGTSITLDSSTVLTLEGNSVDINIGAGSTFTVNDHLGNPIFRVDEDGDLHGLTGKALVFDL
jgi:hypothetical protein